MMMRRSCIFPALAAVVTACGNFFDDAEYLTAEELGVYEKEYVLPAEAGSVEIPFLTNLSGRAALMEDCPWAVVRNPAFDGDGTLVIEYQYNEGTSRSVGVEFSAGPRRDTVLLKQRGIRAREVLFGSRNVVIYNGQGATRIPVDTNVPYEEWYIDIRYLVDAGWITRTALEDGHLVLETEDNPAALPRAAEISVLYDDGWGQVQEAILYLTQARSDNRLGEPVSFAELRARAGAEPLYIEEDLVLTGYVASDMASANVAENTMYEVGTVDYTVSAKSFILESEDGTYGFLVEAASEEDNILGQGDLVSIDLKGLTLVREDDPVRFRLSGLERTQILTSTAGTLPVKRKHIGDLVDEDIYTFVTLTECEFPVRKGPFTPVNEAYTISLNSSRSTKYPQLVRCIDGGSLYLYFNTTCPWRRDGRRKPYGSGDISGIIVHEKFRSWEDGDAADPSRCGTIGRYQMRLQSRDDIRFAEDLADSFSGLITEYLIMEPNPSGDGSWVPTYGNNGSFVHTYTAYTNATYGTHGQPTVTYGCLGPLDATGNGAGTGIILPDGTDWGMETEGLMTPSSGRLDSKLRTCWTATTWWNSTQRRGYAWLVSFSTLGYASDRVSMQISVNNTAQNLRAPRYWKAEWSLTGNMDVSADGDWHLIAEYTVPDVVIWALTQPWQSPGFKSMDFPLPTEILGHEKVYIRMMPTGDAASAGDAYVGSTVASSRASSMDYFAIRYNK